MAITAKTGIDSSAAARTHVALLTFQRCTISKQNVFILCWRLTKNDTARTSTKFNTYICTVDCCVQSKVQVLVHVLVQDTCQNPHATVRDSVHCVAMRVLLPARSLPRCAVADLAWRCRRDCEGRDQSENTSSSWSGYSAVDRPRIY